MKILRLILACGLLSAPLAADTEFYVGPHFHYTRVRYNNPSFVHGYQAGITAGLESRWCLFYSDLQFQGSWNAGPITGDPCQKSEIYEYFLELKLGGRFDWCGNCFEPFVGFGWDRYQNKQDPGTAKLTHRYDKLFVPVGFNFHWESCSNYWGLQFEWRPDVYSRLCLKGESLKPCWGYAFRAALPCKSFCDTGCGCFMFGVTPYFDWNRFGEVDEKNSVGARLDIPRLVRWNLGLNVLIGYLF